MTYCARRASCAPGTTSIEEGMKMKARKIMFWAATGWTPMLLFTVSIFILWLALNISFMWVKLTGLLICLAVGYFLIETMPGGWIWRELNPTPSEATPEEEESK